MNLRTYRFWNAGCITLLAIWFLTPSPAGAVAIVPAAIDKGLSNSAAAASNAPQLASVPAAPAFAAAFAAAAPASNAPGTLAESASAPRGAAQPKKAASNGGSAMLVGACALLAAACLIGWLLWRSIRKERPHASVITESFAKIERSKR